MKLIYSEAIRSAIEHLLKTREEVFVAGQGVWNPWYVGMSMRDLHVIFGHTRVIDTPISENGVTGMCVGAAIMGMRPICVHPRMDFGILCMDAVVNQAAKWSHMFGGQVGVPLVVRMIINRGVEQGAQHSQALHSWFMHVPGLRVVMPYSVQDARDLLVSATLCDDPVIYIDDRWLYDNEDEVEPLEERPLESFGPKILEPGEDVTLVGAGYSTRLCLKAGKILRARGKISCEVVDLRVLKPLDVTEIRRSVSKTGRLLVVDGGWSDCGLATEVIARCAEGVDLSAWRSPPKRITLPEAPAPTSRALEDIYYPKADDLCDAVRGMI
jgi:pyruvate dehydrogenase E1 component beta subunit